MKKFLSLFLALVMVLALAVPALAAPASTNANRNPGTYIVTADDITVRIGGNGNSARLIAYVDGGQYAVFARPDNNRYNIISVAGFELGVFVRGNSILRVSVISGPPPSAHVCNFVYIRTDVVGTKNHVFSVVSSAGTGVSISDATGEYNTARFSVSWRQRANFTEILRRVYKCSCGETKNVYVDVEGTILTRPGYSYSNESEAGEKRHDAGTRTINITSARVQAVVIMSARNGNQNNGFVNRSHLESFTITPGLTPEL